VNHYERASEICGRVERQLRSNHPQQQERQQVLVGRIERLYAVMDHYSTRVAPSAVLALGESSVFDLRGVPRCDRCRKRADDVSYVGYGAVLCERCLVAVKEFAARNPNPLSRGD